MKKSTYKNKSNKLKNRGITLIALVITIVLLIILAGVTISLLLTDNGLFKKAQSTQKIQDLATLQERLELEKAPIQIENEGMVDLESYLEQIQEGEKPYTLDSVEKLNDTNAEIVVDEQYKFLVKDKQNGDVEIIYQGIARVEDLTIDPTSATYTYPTSGTFEVTNNKSGGKLSVKSNNDNIAKASIDGTTVTVTPGTIAGQTEIIVISEANGEYAENKVAHTATVKNGTITLEAEAYKGNYDGKEHDALTKVTTTPEECTLRYALGSEEYSSNMPKVTGANTYTVSVEASKPGYMTTSKSITVTVGKQTNTVGNLELSETSGTLTYPEEKTFKVTNNASGGDLSVTSSNEAVATAKIDISKNPPEVTITPKAITTDNQKTTITVTSAATNNYEEQTVKYEVTVNRGKIEITAEAYTGTYDGVEHNALTKVTTTPEQCTLKYALGKEEYSTNMPKVTGANTYTVSVEASKPGYITTSKSITVTVGQKNANTLDVSLNSTSFTYTGSQINPTVTVKDGAKTLASGTDYTVAFSNNVNVGTATATVTGKGNYTGTNTASYTITPAEITLTADAYKGTYDGAEHNAVYNVSVTPSNATVQYALNSGSYGNTVPKVTGATTYTVHIKASKENYTTKEITKTITISQKNASGFTVSLSGTSFTYTGSQINPTVTVKDGTKTLANGTDYTVAFSNNINVGTAKVTVTGKGNYTGTKTANYTINRAGGSVNLSTSSGTVIIGKTTTFTASGTGALSVSSSNTGVATASISGGTVTVTGKGVGSATITVTSAVATNYNQASKTYSISVKIDESNITIGSGINPDNYGKKVIGYSAGGVSDWQLFYQDANYTYIISSNAAQYIDFEKSIYPEYQNGASISTIGRRLNLPLANSVFSTSNVSKETRLIAWLTDPSKWSKYVTGNALYSIAGPTMELISKQFLYKNIGLKGNPPYQFNPWEPEKEDYFKSWSGYIENTHIDFLNKLYVNPFLVCTPNGEYLLYPLVKTSTATRYQTLNFKDPDEGYAKRDTEDSRTHMAIRPIVCFQTSTFNYKLQ